MDYQEKVKEQDEGVNAEGKVMAAVVAEDEQGDGDGEEGIVDDKETVGEKDVEVEMENRAPTEEIADVVEDIQTAAAVGC